MDLSGMDLPFVPVKPLGSGGATYMPEAEGQMIGIPRFLSNYQYLGQLPPKGIDMLPPYQMNDLNTGRAADMGEVGQLGAIDQLIARMDQVIELMVDKLVQSAMQKPGAGLSSLAQHQWSQYRPGSVGESTPTPGGMSSPVMAINQAEA